LRDQAADQARSLGASLEQEAEGVAAVADRARSATDAIKSSAQRVSDTADTVRSGYKAAKIGAKVAKVVFALFVAKKSTDWLRKLV
jgi:phosphohistidine phosphatase SixA